MPLSEALAFSLALGWDAIALTGDVDGGSLTLHLVELAVIPHGLTFVEGFKAVLLNLRKVDEDVLTSVGRSDEAKTLFRVEELDGSLRGHFVSWWRCSSEEGRKILLNFELEEEDIDLG